MAIGGGISFHNIGWILAVIAALCLFIRAGYGSVGQMGQQMWMGQPGQMDLWSVDPWPINRWFSRSNFENKFNQAYSEYKHVLANILRSRYVARTPPLEARGPGRRSNVENASVTRRSLISNARTLRVN